MKKKLILIIIALTFVIQILNYNTIDVNAKKQGDYVVILHGLGRTANSMNKIADFFKEEGYQVINLGYPSREKRIEALAEQYLKEAIEKHCIDKNKKINFITHSMGGIIVRQYLKQNQVKNLGRVVMLAPPNQGSEVVDFLEESDVVEWVLGPAFKQLGTDEESLPLRLGEVDFELGVIIGDKSVNWINSIIIPGKDDGKVAIENAKVDGIDDFLLVSRTHLFVMYSNQVLEQMHYFLENGQFKRK